MASEDDKPVRFAKELLSCVTSSHEPVEITLPYTYYDVNLSLLQQILSGPFIHSDSPKLTEFESSFYLEDRIDVKSSINISPLSSDSMLV